MSTPPQPPIAPDPDQPYTLSQVMPDQRSRRRPWLVPAAAAAALVLVLAAAGVVFALSQNGGGASSSVAAPSPTTGATTATPTPSPVDRGFACRTATKLTGTAAELLTDFSKAADPATFDRVPLTAAINDMRASQRMLPPDLAQTYEGFITPLDDIDKALSYGGEVSIDGDAFRANALTFLTDCNAWMNG